MMQTINHELITNLELFIKKFLNEYCKYHPSTASFTISGFALRDFLGKLDKHKVRAVLGDEDGN